MVPQRDQFIFYPALVVRDKIMVVNTAAKFSVVAIDDYLLPVWSIRQTWRQLNPTTLSCGFIALC